MTTAKYPTYAGLFLLTLATVAYEILLTRIFSVTMWYHFAFVAISVAMFGMSAGAIFVYVWPRWFSEDRTGWHLVVNTVLFSAATILSFFYHRSVPFTDDVSLRGVLFLTATYLVTALPFLFGGIVVCLVLTRFPLQTSKLYAVDLLGAATGCLVPIGLLKVVDAPTAIFCVALLGVTSALCFAIKQSARMQRVAAYGIVICLALMVVNRAMDGTILRLQYVKGVHEGPLLYEKWNHFSRVTVVDQPLSKSPMGWGLSPRFRPERIPQKELMLWMDGPAAATPITHYEGSFDNLQHLHFDVVNMAHYLRQDANVLVVGVGGGRDILSALAFHQKSVLGVEINNNILETVNGAFGEFSGHLDRDPRVTFVNDEARSYVARQNNHFDIIQVSLIDTFAASAAGAFVLTENSLYTTEAWNIFLSKLSDRGILTFSRWYFSTRPAEMYRLTALATQSLLNNGIMAPRKHIIIVRRGGAIGVGTILVSRQPFSYDEIGYVRDICKRMGFDAMLTPQSDEDPFLAKIADGQNLDQVVRSYSLNIAPPTDDSPFFFNMLRFREFLHPANLGNMSQNTRAIFTLTCLSIIVLVLTAACIILPLLIVSERSVASAHIPQLFYFAAIGLGFMLIEVSQMQRLIVFLGHPTYALSVVLFSLLVFSGFGSYSTKWVLGAGDAAVRLALLLISLALFGLSTPVLTSHFQADTTPLRMLVAVAILAPIGFVMGMAFPIGMRAALRSSPSLAPWLWGINGATSVCASVLAVVLAISSGIHSAFWVGVSAYVVAASAYLYEYWPARQGSREFQTPALQAIRG